MAVHISVGYFMTAMLIPQFSSPDISFQEIVESAESSGWPQYYPVRTMSVHDDNMIWESVRHCLVISYLSQTLLSPLPRQHCKMSKHHTLTCGTDELQASQERDKGRGGDETKGLMVLEGAVFIKCWANDNLIHGGGSSVCTRRTTHQKDQTTSIISKTTLSECVNVALWCLQTENVAESCWIHWSQVTWIFVKWKNNSGFSCLWVYLL